MILNLFAGPGGLDQGAHILGLTTPIHGIDTDADACATARNAGFHRAQGSVTDLNPEDSITATGATITSPCPTFSAAGKGTGRGDLGIISAALTALGDNYTGAAPDDAHESVRGRVADPRSALVVETLKFAFRMPNVRWLIAEQVPAAGVIFQEIGAELAAAADWEFCAVATIAAEELGVASRRARSFMIAARDYTPEFGTLPMRALWTCGRFSAPRQHGPSGTTFPQITMAQALGWPAGERINTRGARKPTGGNEFSADRPAWCLTEKARSWKRVSDGAHLTAAQAGLLTGFPADYPWQGSRSKQFLQAADVVSPPVAAALLGTVLGTDWRKPVRDYLTDIYPHAAVPSDRPLYVHQPSLFEEAVA